ncbi:hypothetical protein Avbf_03695 [Armadillidium vulgare]|nr:hypothetical protein Avbf_03695 [Armadillidium vulgare]
MGLVEVKSSSVEKMCLFQLSFQKFGAKSLLSLQIFRLSKRKGCR